MKRWPWQRPTPRVDIGPDPGAPVRTHGREMSDVEAAAASMTMPHCDAAVLHAPGACTYCDRHPDWQAYRLAARINFTGERWPDRAACPSTLTRPAAQVDAWPGNQARPRERRCATCGRTESNHPVRHPFISMG